MGMAPTSTMPTSIKATYTGETKQTITETATGDEVGEFMADLELTADWTDGQTANPWSGKATNFRGDIAGSAFETTEELTVAKAEADGFTGAIGRTELPKIPGVPIPDGAATGSGTVSLAGEGTDDDGNNHYVLMNLGSLVFVGDNAEKAYSGNASTQSFKNGAVREEYVGSGEVYLEQ